MKLKGVVEVEEKKNKTGIVGEGCTSEGDGGQKTRDMCRMNKKNKAEKCAQNARQMK